MILMLTSSNIYNLQALILMLRALAVGLPYAKCKVHLAYRPKKCLATRRLNLGNAKFF